MNGAFGHDLSPLASHEVQQLIDQERRRQGRHPAAGDRDTFPTDGTAERASVSSL